ncbi:MAG TPA: hypothetical protein VMF10_01180 [Candidatus Aquilonibacter sp.]|nr:hypothetical protein [Candidatus Aquilonibacter sp.]
MHIHQNQMNPTADLDAAYAAQRSAAKREAVRTRKKLTELASELEGASDAEAWVVSLGAGEESKDETKRQTYPRGGKPTKRREPAPEGAENSISDWA